MAQSLEENKAVFRMFIEKAFNSGNLAAIDDLVNQDFIEHQHLPVRDSGRQALKQLVTWLRTTFPDLHYKIENMIAEGDKVAAHMSFRGTQKGEFMGIPPTGKQINSEVIDIVRISDGKIVEHWGIPDNLRVIQQLRGTGAPV